MSQSKGADIPLKKLSQFTARNFLLRYDGDGAQREPELHSQVFCKNNNDSAFYRAIVKQRDDETIANLCITMIRQELYLLLRLIERAKTDFLENGGIREEMTRARLKYRKGET